jgi:hypothetical protein
LKRAAGELDRLHVVKSKVKTGEGDIKSVYFFDISVGSENRLNFGMSADF